MTTQGKCCVYNSTAEGVNILKRAYIAVHQKDPTNSTGRKMKKNNRTSITIISLELDCVNEFWIVKTSHLNHSLQSFPIIHFEKNESITIMKQIKILANDKMLYILPPTDFHPPKTTSCPKKWDTTIKQNQHGVWPRRIKIQTNQMMRLLTVRFISCGLISSWKIEVLKDENKDAGLGCYCILFTQSQGHWQLPVFACTRNNICKIQLLW